MDFFRRFAAWEAAGGVALVVAALVAMLLVNSAWGESFSRVVEWPLGWEFVRPLNFWINDGLMAVFFLVVGLEIKRELLEGKLAGKGQVALPACAALGGIAVPALLYAAINWRNPAGLAGWAVPSATDIAFALGVMQLLGKRVPVELKLCLVTLAILDDLAAIVIIALFYSQGLSPVMLLGAAGVGAALWGLNRRGVTRLALYLLLGAVLWGLVYASGIHPTVAGVGLAFAIPLRGEKSPAKRLEEALHPWAAFGIIPLFALANAGVPLQAVTRETLQNPVTLGVAAGLFFGKQAGVMGATWLACRLKLCRLPQGVGWGPYYGMALLTGVGFTMSLFIGMLAFKGVEQVDAVRLGVLAGSVASGVAGLAVLWGVGRKQVGR